MPLRLSTPGRSLGGPPGYSGVTSSRSSRGVFISRYLNRGRGHGAGQRTVGRETAASTERCFPPPLVTAAAAAAAAPTALHPLRCRRRCHPAAAAGRPPVLDLRQPRAPLQVAHKQVLDRAVGAARQQHGDGCMGGGRGSRRAGTGRRARGRRGRRRGAAAAAARPAACCRALTRCPARRCFWRSMRSRSAGRPNALTLPVVAIAVLRLRGVKQGQGGPARQWADPALACRRRRCFARRAAGAPHPGLPRRPAHLHDHCHLPLGEGALAGVLDIRAEEVAPPGGGEAAAAVGEAHSGPLRRRRRVPPDRTAGGGRALLPAAPPRRRCCRRGRGKQAPSAAAPGPPARRAGPRASRAPRALGLAGPLPLAATPPCHRRPAIAPLILRRRDPGPRGAPRTCRCSSCCCARAPRPPPSPTRGRRTCAPRPAAGRPPAVRSGHRGQTRLGAARTGPARGAPGANGVRKKLCRSCTAPARGPPAPSTPTATAWS
jgi:hypothetical protein